MWPLDVSAGIPKESGVRWAFLAHHSMELTAHLLPAPGSFLLEAEQLFRECFLAALGFLHKRAKAGHPNTFRGG